MDPKLVAPVFVGVFMVWVIVRRICRNVGRQEVQEKRLWFRAGVLALVGAMLLLGALAHPLSLLALCAGVAAGAGLGVLGLKHTLFERTPQGRFYTPHTVIGLVVSGLLIARLVYRYVALTAVAATATTGLPSGTNPADMFQRSPLTLAVFGIVVGYYVCYNIGVLRKSAAPSP